MAIPVNLGDLSRTISTEPDQTWPKSVKVQLHWDVDGHVRVRTLYLTADQFFGLGSFGAPMEGAALIGMIENMRRQGPPVVERRISNPRKKNGTKKR